MATGMKADWSWQRSAREYVALYEEIKPQGSSARNIPAGFERPARTVGPPRGREPLKFGPRTVPSNRR